ncbi:porin family protein [Chryseobacterium sp. MMS23-Vi53]|uniref:porin family protein n=1 Tax=Chryseobacterium sp. MMS23-Vi53 TaxID=3386644 RepID=UPI0039EB98FF
MKKMLLSSALFVGVFTFAQNSQIRFGIKAGLNVSRISNTETIDESPRNALHAGVFGNFPFAEKFSFQPELLYSTYGEKEKSSDVYAADDINVKSFSNYSIKLDYITIPLMFQYNMLPNLYVEAGPEVGILFSERVRGTSEIITTSGNSTSTSTEDFKSPVERKNFQGVNLGFGVGAGYYITPKFGINARYVAGLSDVMKQNPLHHSNAIKNNVFQFGVMYKF